MVIDVLANDNFQPGAQITQVSTPANGTVQIAAVGTSALALEGARFKAEITQVSAPANGTLDVDDEGQLIYTPDPDFHGTDTFAYTVTTSNGGKDTATVVVTIDPVVDIVDDTITTPEDTPVTINVLGNDNFESTPTLTGVTNGTNGTVRIENGQAVYTPNADFNGEDTFSYTVTTPDGGTETATVTVTVRPVVDIANDLASTNVNTPVAIEALNNDSFESAVDITNLGDPNNGTVMLDADDQLIYTPATGFRGTDSFTYTVTTTPGNTETATVTVEVGGPPVIGEVEVVVSEAALPEGSGNPPNGVTETASGTLAFDDGSISDLNVLSGPGSDSVSKAITDDTITLRNDDGL